ncbi:flagellar hook-length control protein FliK [Enterobacter chengduensis]|uniref:flagellar hook-length control protein FliK n=1 Tax=Enterobacter chengduensis TaxID=2494701 RepID=UPI00200390B3|nr:flagellar hook-length control protein FliK [Enterobacter chengduensis]MCK7429614.1 flagellar hook-length control protein FliK [Enterobacter chengduensis]
MNLVLSQLTQLPVAAEPVDAAPLPAFSATGLVVPVAGEDVSQAAPAFNDALLNIINTLMGVEQPRENPLVLAGVSAKDDDDERKAQRDDPQALENSIIGSPERLLDALLMASQMPVKTLNVTQTPAPLAGDTLQIKHLSAGPQPVAEPLPRGPQIQPQPQLEQLNVAPAPVLEPVKPTLHEPSKALATALPGMAQPTGGPAFTAGMDKQTVNLPPIAMDADEAKWAQQLHGALNERLQLQVRSQVQHATIRLDPPEMGKVEISLHIENGRMQVHISASSGETYRALQQISSELRQSLTEQNVMQVNVQVSSQSGQQQQQGQPRSMFAPEEGPAAGAEIAPENTLSTADRDDSVLLTV